MQAPKFFGRSTAWLKFGRSRAWLRRSGLALILLEAAYLLAGNLFLNLEVAERLVNHKPEKLKVVWERGWTVVPGLAHARGVEVRGQTRTVQWFTRIDEVRVWIDLIALFGKRFEAGHVVGEGFDFRLRPRHESAAEAAEVAALLPPIPGLTNPPDPAPEDLYPRKAKKRRWVVQLADVDLGRVHQIWIDKQHFVGDGRLSGDMRFEIRGPLEIDQATLEITSGELRLGEETIAEDLALQLTTHFDPFVPREHKGLALLSFLSGELRLAAPRTQFGFLDYYFRGTPWLSVGGHGELAAHLTLDHGKLVPESHLDMVAKRLTVSYLDFLVEGSGRIAGRVEGLEGASEGTLAVVFDRFAIARKDGATPHVEGQGLRFDASTRDLDLSQREPAIEAVLDLPDSDIPHLEAYNVYVPEASGFAFTGGQGRIHGRMEFSSAPSSVSGAFELRGQEIAARFGDLRFLGDLRLATRLESGDLKARQFDFAGTELELSRVGVAAVDKPAMVGDWWAKVALPQAEIALRTPLDGQARIDARMRDSAPIVAFLVDKKPILRWLDNLLMVENIAAQADIGISAAGVDVRDLALEGDKLEVRAEMRLAEKRPSGIFFVELGKLAAALELTAGGERDWKLVHPRRWYDSRSAARRGGR